MKMTSNKKIAGIIILGAIIVVGLLPIMLYGVSVSVTQMNISLSGTPSSSSITVQAGSPSYQIGGVDVTGKEMNAYEYMFNRMGGQISGSDASTAGDGTVQIQIVFDLTTPKGEKLSFSFNPLELGSTGDKDVIVTMGPGDLNGEVGTFFLTITISVKITPPIGQVVDLNLSPVGLNFTVSE